MVDWLYTALLLAHILLLVFWVGTDVGVFLAAKYSERADLSAETRSTVLAVGMVLDRLPRSALVLIIPSGLLLADHAGVFSVSKTSLLGICSLAALWLGLLWRGFLAEDPVQQAFCARLNLILSGLAAIGVCGVSITLLLQDQIALWLGLKLLLVGVIFALGVLLDIQFRPAVIAFTQLMTEGASDDRNLRYSRAIAPVYLTVLSIYLLAIIAAALGIAKR
jgi:hypothetical protein